MNDMLSKGYTVKVPTSHLSCQVGQIWYIPHNEVYHPQKKKLREVFDCAASFQGMSLNSELLQGPDMTNSLIGVLTCFRQESVAMMADVEAMYYQVRAPEKDSDMLRFLWWQDGDVNQNLDEYKMVTHLFGAMSFPKLRFHHKNVPQLRSLGCYSVCFNHSNQGLNEVRYKKCPRLKVPACEVELLQISGTFRVGTFRR